MLKPCPFCGCDIDLLPLDADEEVWGFHPDSECGMGGVHISPTEFEGWNTRAPDPRVARLVAAAKEFEKEFWKVAERHNDMACCHDVNPVVRQFRKALAEFDEGK